VVVGEEWVHAIGAVVVGDCGVVGCALGNPDAAGLAVEGRARPGPTGSGLAELMALLLPQIVRSAITHHRTLRKLLTQWDRASTTAILALISRKY
jgi:hypothetical protein